MLPRFHGAGGSTRRVLASLVLLWFFYRFDFASLEIIADGGQLTQEPCEAHAAIYGWSVVLISSRPELDAKGKVRGYWQRACRYSDTDLRNSNVVINPR